MKNVWIAGIAMATLSVFSTGAIAAAGDKGRGHKGPPQVAFDSCAGASQGTSCTFTGRKGKDLSGTCEIPRGERLVCVPEGHKRGSDQQQG